MPKMYVRETSPLKARATELTKFIAKLFGDKQKRHQSRRHQDRLGWASSRKGQNALQR